MYKDKVKFLRSLKYWSPMSQHISIDRAHQLNELISHAISQTSLASRQNVQYRVEQEQVYMPGDLSQDLSVHEPMGFERGVKPLMPALLQEGDQELGLEGRLSP